MKVEVSSQAPELNSDHGDIDPSFGAGFGGFVLAYQAALAHQPTKSTFHDPATRQDGELVMGVNPGNLCNLLVYSANSVASTNYGSGGFQTDTLVAGTSPSPSVVDFNSLHNS